MASLSSPNSPKRFALLVGVDAYQSDGTRKTKNDEPSSLRNLSGCVNDAQAIKEFLEANLGSITTYLLTSTPSTGSNVPKGSAEHLPTFKNIRNVFKKITKDASEDDQFIFHFSGHGARLKRTSGSPQDGREEDPSLMTVDYCCGMPGVRGWQLNRWLRRLHKNKVQVIVSLDSCYSAGAWRNEDHLRTPENWEPPLNLPADEDLDEEDEDDLAGTDESTHRDGSLTKSWDINPDRLTLITACRSDQTAIEKFCGTKTHGVFTFEMLTCLENHWPRITYRTLRDQVAAKLDRQKPQSFGHDRLLVFGNKEPLSAVPMIFQHEGDHAILPVGRIHGIQKGAQFTTLDPSAPTIFTVDQVDVLKCRARTSPELPVRRRNNNEIVLLRWSIIEQPLEIFIDSSFSGTFQDLLQRNLQDRIYGDIKVVRHSLSNSTVFRLAKGKGGRIDMFGPEPTIGYTGPVRGVNIKENISEEQGATMSALYLAHLIRFERVLNLRHEASQSEKPFKVDLERLGGFDEELYRHDELIRYTIKNESTSYFNFSVVILSPGFHIKQLYPQWDTLEMLKPGESKPFKFRLKIPVELREGPSSSPQKIHRDILRTIATIGDTPSFKGLEMPDLWNIGHLVGESYEDAIRHANLELNRSARGAHFEWWIEDVEMKSSA